jgi:hypothetical protein
MTAIRHKTTVAAPGILLEANAERHLKSPEEMARLFAAWPHAIAPRARWPMPARSALTNCATNIREETYPDGLDAQAYLESADLGRRRAALSRRRAREVCARRWQGTGADRQKAACAVFPDHQGHRRLRAQSQDRRSCARGAARGQFGGLLLPGITSVDPANTSCCSNASFPRTATSRPTSTSISNTNGARR